MSRPLWLTASPWRTGHGTSSQPWLQSASAQQSEAVISYLQPSFLAPLQPAKSGDRCPAYLPYRSRVGTRQRKENHIAFYLACPLLTSLKLAFLIMDGILSCCVFVLRTRLLRGGQAATQQHTSR